MQINADFIMDKDAIRCQIMFDHGFEAMDSLAGRIKPE